MEKNKSYTDIEQSKKLAEILPSESADMMYGYIAPYDYSDRMFDGGYDEIPYPKDFFKVNPNFSENEYDGELPCWSLAALLKLLPQKIEHEGYEAELHINSRMTDLWYENDNFIYFGTFAEKLIDACVQLICTLNEKGLLWTEKK